MRLTIIESAVGLQRARARSASKIRLDSVEMNAPLATADVFKILVSRHRTIPRRAHRGPEGRWLCTRC